MRVVRQAADLHTGVGRFDFVSEPGVSSFQPKAWRPRTNPKGSGTGVNCWRLIKSRAAGKVWHLFLGGSLGRGFLAFIFGARSFLFR